MPADGGAARVLHALAEPALVVGTDGLVALANRAALERLGPGASGRLTALSPGPEAAAGLRAYLLHCSGSSSPLPGAAELRDAAGRTVRFRCHAGLLEPACGGSPARVLLRLSDASDERFAALAQKVQDLNEEIRRRRRTQLLLEEALRERDLLLRELHHRVKNNIHMLSGMLSAARRETVSPEAVAVLAEASRRLAAVATVHQMLYQGENLRGVRGDEFVARVAAAAMEAAGARERLSIEADRIEVANDATVPVALILNELLANAVKHGIRGDGLPGQVLVGLAAGPDGLVELSVEDDGPGFEPDAMAGRRASGLGLVRGLSRQLGGSFSIARGRNGGARCLVRFQERRGMAPPPGGPPA